MGTEYVFVQQMVVLSQEMEQNLQHMLNSSLTFEQRWAALRYAECQAEAMGNLLSSFRNQLEGIKRLILS